MLRVKQFFGRKLHPNRFWMKRLLRLGVVASFCSVSLNTPKTFELYPFLSPVTFACDLITGLLFTAEMIKKITIRGLLKGEKSYLRDRWCLFDSSMLFFLWVSVILQTLEMSALVSSASNLSILRAPRPLIMIRFIRVFLKFSMPKNQINQILKRSGQQIYNVTLFFVFFMSLYGLLGVQFMGELRNHCILKDTDPEHVTINSLTIPDTYCSMDPFSGYQCPEGKVCTKLKESRYKLGFKGFDDIGASIFTVYQAFSQDGWVFTMNRAKDTLPAWRALIYFTTMIFFLSLLVKNVFIAVIIETLHEFRVQFKQIWNQRNSQFAGIVDAGAPVIVGDDHSWKFVPNDAMCNQNHAFSPVLNSAAFHLLLMVAILANSLITASISFKHDGRPRSEILKPYYYIEVGFTVFFNLEALFKIWCLGFWNYYGRPIYKFELLFLAIGTTLHLLPQFYLSVLTFFQVSRILRLIKAIPILDDFVYKILGPGNKLVILILFTICFLIITSTISMHLFCSIVGFTKFETFPQAFTSMFQILTQEYWTEIMEEAMFRINETFVLVIIAIYFIFNHLFVAIIVLSLFVAVILDNLGLDEDIKKLKQMNKAREQSEIKKTLLRRLKHFKKLPDDHPRMARLKEKHPDFILPRVPDTFLRQFMLETNNAENLPKNQGSKDNKPNLKVSKIDQKQAAINDIIRESNSQRFLLEDSTNELDKIINLL